MRTLEMVGGSRHRTTVTTPDDPPQGFTVAVVDDLPGLDPLTGAVDQSPTARMRMERYRLERVGDMTDDRTLSDEWNHGYTRPADPGPWPRTLWIGYVLEGLWS